MMGEEAKSSGWGLQQQQDEAPTTKGTFTPKVPINASFEELAECFMNQFEIRVMPSGQQALCWAGSEDLIQLQLPAKDWTFDGIVPGVEPRVVSKKPEMSLPISALFPDCNWAACIQIQQPPSDDHDLISSVSKALTQGISEADLTDIPLGGSKRI